MARLNQVLSFSSLKPTAQPRPSTRTPASRDFYDNAQHALKTLIKMLANSLACTAVGWMLAFCISHGNVASQRVPSDQTYTEFLTVKILWFDVFYWTIGLATSVYKLLPEHFLIRQTPTKLTFAQVLAKLVPPMLPFVVGVSLVSVGGTVGIACMPFSVRKFRLDLYWSFICCAFFVAAVDTQTRHIYKVETVAGQTREQSRSQGNPSSPRRQRQRPSAKQYLHVLCQSLPFCISSLFAAAYAHAVSTIPMQSQWSITTFAVASVGLKALLQEIIKYYLNQQKQTPADRTIAILIAVPTILVDTQLRTVLLCQNTVASTLFGSSLLAAVEIAVRLARTLHVARKHRSLSQCVLHVPRTAHVVPQPHLAKFLSSTSLPDQRRLSRAKKMMALHAAEVYTDMNAEYIAMGCSYAILFFFGSHTRFNLGDQTGASYSIFPVTIALQVGIELVVDFGSSVFEIRLGIDFESFNEDGAYLAFFMMVIAITNIHISSGFELDLLRLWCLIVRDNLIESTTKMTLAIRSRAQVVATRYFEGKTWAQLVVKVRHDRVQPLTQSSGTTSTHQRISSFGSRAHPLTIAWCTIRTLGTVLSNSLLSAAIAWLLAFCIDQGNIFSSVTSKEQPHAVFLTAKMIWFWIFAWVFTIAECVAKLLPETFTSPSSSTPFKLSATKLIIKLVRAMFVHIVGVSAMSIGVGFAIASDHLAHNMFKADVYWPMMCYNFILTVTDAHTRHIFRVETVNGKARARRPSRHIKQPQQPPRTPRRTPSGGHFVRVFVQNLALVISGLSAGAFVHVASSIEMKEKWQLVLFAMCSQTIKLLIQATAKLYLGKRKKTPSMRTMAIIVSAPTILVDTQLRTVLLCLDSTSMTLTGSVLLAIAKTGLRLLTALHMRHQTRKILIKYPPPSVAMLPQDSTIRTHRVQSLLSARGSSSAPELEGIARVQKLTALHAAEVYADMHGEYIAMCCAYVIIICFGSNPRFVLGGNASTKSTHEIELSTILVQMGIEVVVDIIAIPLEIRFGVNFEKFQTDDAFLAIFMVLVAVVSIHIASGVYMKI